MALWIYFPNGYIFSSNIEDRRKLGDRDTFDVAVLKYFERGPIGIIERLRRFFKKTRFISAEFVEKSEFKDIPIEIDSKSDVLAFRHLGSGEMERLKRFVASRPRRDSLTVTITGFSSEISDKSLVNWDEDKN